MSKGRLLPGGHTPQKPGVVRDPVASPGPAPRGGRLSGALSGDTLLLGNSSWHRGCPLWGLLVSSYNKYPSRLSYSRPQTGQLLFGYRPKQTWILPQDSPGGMGRKICTGITQTPSGPCSVLVGKCAESPGFPCEVHFS